MRIIDRNRRLIIKDSPGLFWVLGVLFVGVGTLFALGPFGLLAEAATLAWWERALIALLGASGVGAGLWFLGRSPGSTLSFDRDEGRLEVVRFGLIGRQRTAFPAGDVAGVRLTEKLDDEGAAVFQVQLMLRDGQTLPVSELWMHGREGFSQAASRLGDALAVPVTFEFRTHDNPELSRLPER